MIVDENSEEVIQEVLTFLTDWLVHHILETDKKIKAVIPTKTNKSTVMIAKYNGDELKKIRIYSAM